MRSKDIIDHAMNENDPLCMKVVAKFTEVLGVECGNFALLTLPYGGIYLLGGVVNGIEKYLKSKEGSEVLMTALCNKGRLQEFC